MASDYFPLQPLRSLANIYDSMRIPVKKADRKPGPYPYYGASGIVDYVDSYIFDGKYLLLAEDGENLRSQNLPIAFMATGKFWVNNHAHILQGRNGNNTRYLCYALKTADIGSYLSGSTRPKLTQGDMKRIPVSCPKPDEQRAIAHILGSLDDKIELNRRMNQTLETTARAIFKSWFVDFDPLVWKAVQIGNPVPERFTATAARYRNGTPCSVPDEIAALFPDSFKDSEIGEIPKGWKVKSIGEVAEFPYGKALKASNRKPGDIPVFGSNGQVGVHNEALVKGPGIVIGRKGNPGIVTWSYKDFFPIDTTFYVKRTGVVSSLNYLYYALKNQDLPSLSADSAVPGLNRNLAYMSKFLVPYEKLLAAFDEQIDPLFYKIYANEKESETLASLRDTLLPKLISGKLRVPDAEKFIEEAGL